VQGITRYAAKYKPLGGLMTTWEKSVEFYAETYPIIALAGKLWSSPDAVFEDVLGQSIRETSNITKPEVLTALKNWFCYKRSQYSLRTAFARGEVTSLEETQGRMLETLHAVIGETQTDQNPVLEDISISLREQMLKYRTRKAVYETILAKIEGRKTIDFTSLKKETDVLHQSRLSQWNRFREGISNEPLKRSFETEDKSFTELMKKIESADTWLFVRFFLPDVWAAPWINLIVENDRGEKITVLKSTVLKPPIDELSFYEYVFPFTMAGSPKTLTIEVAGYGGQGVSYAKFFDNRGTRFVPECIRGTSGQVDQPVDILADDLRWCYLGEKEVLRGFRSASSAKAIHSLTVGFSAEK
jgi:hypothetical protein